MADIAYVLLTLSIQKNRLQLFLQVHKATNSLLGQISPHLKPQLEGVDAGHEGCPEKV